jgi:uncharacterized protein
LIASTEPGRGALMTATAQKVSEPSMEEILASIRRIIADDQTRARTSMAKTAPITPASPDDGSASQSFAEPPISLAKVEETVAAEPSAPQGAPMAGDSRLTANTSVDLSAKTDPMAPEPTDEETSPGATEQPESITPTDLSAPPPSGAPREERRSYAPERTSEAGASQHRPTIGNSRITGSVGPVGRAASYIQSPIAKEAADQGPSAPEPPLSNQASGRQEKREVRETPAVTPTQPSHIAGHAPARTIAPQYHLAAQHAPFTHEQASILSGEADATIARAFNSLSRTVLSDNARTLEDLVREMLRPLLKAWLDDNLPPLVERLVRVEIERVARGRPG